MLPPLVFEPLLKRIRWGGRRLGTHLRKPIGDGNDYAESWEIADHGQDNSRVLGGACTGTTLRQLMQTHPRELLDWLSLQVHPDDNRARLYDPDEKGKT